ncbi:hypothetical protein BYT27DRAFT_6474446 [Phlegmacium glaucopus]|nr:hypothetical protein BYT27DRAFT_6474446 [Phlegmacium glaucopus]
MILYCSFQACVRVVRCQVFPMLHLRLCRRCQTANLITVHDLQIIYQNALDLIYHLPASSSQCFKPEAQLLIQKFLSLKHENSLKFINNVEQHTRAKRRQRIPIPYIATDLRRTCRTKWSCGYGLRR